MFYNCNSLCSLPDISKWKIDKSININEMLDNLQSLIGSKVSSSNEFIKTNNNSSRISSLSDSSERNVNYIDSNLRYYESFQSDNSHNDYYEKFYS